MFLRHRFFTSETTISANDESPLHHIGTAPIGVSGQTLIETSGGWMQASDLSEGDLIATFDGGFRPIVQIAQLPGMEVAQIHIPGGVLNNDSDILVPEDQFLLLTGDLAEARFGLPVVLVRAKNLAGQMGITRADPSMTVLYQLRFADEEVIWANSGLLVHCSSTDRPDALPQDFALAQPQAIENSETPIRRVGGRLAALRDAA